MKSVSEKESVKGSFNGHYRVVSCAVISENDGAENFREIHKIKGTKATQIGLRSFCG